MRGGSDSLSEGSGLQGCWQAGAGQLGSWAWGGELPALPLHAIHAQTSLQPSEPSESTPAKRVAACTGSGRQAGAGRRQAHRSVLSMELVSRWLPSGDSRMPVMESEWPARLMEISSRRRSHTCRGEGAGRGV